MTTFKQIRKANIDRCEEKFHKLSDWSLSDYATALTEEVGEICGAIKRLNRYRPTSKIAAKKTQKELMDNLEEEIGDVLLILDLLAARENICIEGAVVSKFNKTSDKVGSNIKL